MKYISFLKDKIITLLVFIIISIFITILFIFSNIHKTILLLFIFILFILFVFEFIYEYFRRKSFYKTIKNKIKLLDKNYLIHELIDNDNFLEAKLFKSYLYEIDKTYIEDINKYKYFYKEFKEYIELWCHEIKIPISTSKLIIDNNKNKITNNILEEIEKIESFTEQVMFYARSENVNKDYMITDVNIKDIVNSVIVKNKKDIIEKKIKIDMFKEDVLVKSDSKWLIYIINQIIINSIKYSKKKNAMINVYPIVNKNNVILNIEDNGIGIKNEELSKVFDKGFTGSNGRIMYSSTGMGLYLSKKLCLLLGHDLNITSKIDKFTRLSIVFPKSNILE